MIPIAYRFEIYLSVDKDWQMKRNHFHDDMEILLSLTEGGNFFLNQNSYVLKRGSLMIIDGKTLHRSFSTLPNCNYERYVLHVSGDTLRALSSAQTNIYSFFEQLNCCIILDEVHTQRLSVLLAACLEQQGDAFGQDLYRDISFIQLMLAICEILNQNNFSISHHTKSDTIMPIIKYIEEHIGEHLNLDLLSQQLFVSKHYLCHIFKEATGYTVMEYITHSRILKAQKLLLNGFSVQTTGELVGFNNNAHFIRTFRKLIGIPPGQYAKKHSNDSFRQ